MIRLREDECAFTHVKRPRCVSPRAQQQQKKMGGERELGARGRLTTERGQGGREMAAQWWRGATLPA